MSTWPFVSAPEIFTGNVATVNDPFNTALFNNGARMLLGTRFYQTDSSGRRTKYVYVRLNSTTPPTLIVGPVFWKDNTFTVVTAVSTEGLYGINAVAGLLLNANATNGNYVMIQLSGHAAAVPAPASTAAGDTIIGASGNQQLARVAANTAPTNNVFAFAETAVSGGKSDMYLALEDVGF
jgi:hypothetical protein